MAIFTWRDLEGTQPERDQPNNPNPPVPRDAPDVTRLEGTGLPWIEGLEDPFTPVVLPLTPYPQMDTPDVGWQALPADYRGEYRTRGPVVAFGHEVSGGLQGDQAVGRTMRFPINIPDRYDANGVHVGDYRDLLAVSLEMNKVDTFSDTDRIDDLVSWTGPDPQFHGWEG